MKTETLKVNGMSCGHCVKTITDSLKLIDGVRDVDVSLPEKKVTIYFEESKVHIESLKEQIVESGYEIA